MNRWNTELRKACIIWLYFCDNLFDFVDILPDMSVNLKMKVNDYIVFMFCVVCRKAC